MATVPIATGQMQTLSFKEEATYGTSAGGNFALVEHNTNSLALTINTLEEATLRGSREVQELLTNTHAVSGDIVCNFAQQDSQIEFIKAALADFTAENTNQFVVGTQRKSYSIAREFNDLVDLTSSDAVTGDAHLFLGMEVNSFGLSVPADGFVTATYGFIGSDMTLHDASQDGSATAVSSKVPYRGSDTHIIVEDTGGSSSFASNFDSASTIITQFDLAIDNGLENTYVVGNNLPVQGPIGRSRVTGSFTAHFTSGDAMNRFINAHDTRIHVLCGAHDANGMSFELPRCRFTNVTTEVGGEGMIEVSVEFTALERTATGASCITFDSAES